MFNTAIAPRGLLQSRLLFIQKGGHLSDHRGKDFVDLLKSNDLIVVNDAATMPASLMGRLTDGTAVEVRLTSRLENGSWRAVIFRGGDWRTPTENRAKLTATPGLRIWFDENFSALLTRVVDSQRGIFAIDFNFRGDQFWENLYRIARAVQYSHHQAALDLWDIQTAYATRPWAVEMPSAGRILSAGTLVALRRKGIDIGRLTHTAGLSSIGTATDDALLPFDEHYEIPQATIDAIKRCRGSGGRVIAIGTTTVRALESWHLDPERRLASSTELIIDPHFCPQVVQGVLSGVHDVDESHYQLLRAFLKEEIAKKAIEHAQRQGYYLHEFGDFCLVL